MKRIVDLSATAAQIRPGGSSILAWWAPGAASSALDNGIGSVSGQTGSVTVTPAVTTDYTIVSTWPDGSTATSTIRVAILASGLVGNYFLGDNFALNDGSLVGSRIDANLGFTWSGLSPFPGIDAGIPFSVFWAGYIIPLYSEQYTLTVFSDNALTLYVDGQFVCLGNGGGVSATISLRAGVPVSIYAAYWDDIGAPDLATAILKWQSASQSLQIVPASAFYQAQPPAPSIGPNVSIYAGETVAIDWQSNAQVNSVDHGVGNLGNAQVSALIGPLPGSNVNIPVPGLSFGVFVVSPFVTTTYTLSSETAGYPDGAASVTVTVVPGPNPVIRLTTAGPRSIIAGSPVVLDYRTNSPNSTINNGVGVVAAPGGSVTVYPAEPTAYLLTDSTAGFLTFPEAVWINVTPLLPPMGLQATSAYQAVILSWDAPQGAFTSFNVLRNGVSIGTTGGSNYTDTTGAPWETYEYSVETVNNAVTSAPSATATARPFGLVDAPSQMAASPVLGGMVLSWLAVPNAAGYNLYRGLAPTTLATVQRNILGRIVFDHADDQRPFFWAVSAVGMAGESALSNIVSGTAYAPVREPEDAPPPLSSSAIIPSPPSNWS